MRSIVELSKGYGNPLLRRGQLLKHPLKAIVAGGRDRTLANHPELHYRMAGEILFLLETLENLQRPPPSKVL